MTNCLARHIAAMRTVFLVATLAIAAPRSGQAQVTALEAAESSSKLALEATAKLQHHRAWSVAVRGAHHDARDVDVRRVEEVGREAVLQAQVTASDDYYAVVEANSGAGPLAQYLLHIDISDAAPSHIAASTTWPRPERLRSSSAQTMP